MRGSLANEAQSRRGRKKCAFEDLGILIYYKFYGSNRSTMMGSSLHHVGL